MRELFRSYYKPTRQELSEIWQEGTFSFDSNILLHTYSYTLKTRERFFEILDRIQDRIWLPNQVAYEYQNNRVKVILKESKAYSEIHKILDESLEDIKNNIRRYNKHSFIKTNEIVSTLERAFKRVKSNLTKANQEHPDFLQSDDLREKFTELLEGKVGEPYSEEDLEEIYKEAERRFNYRKPPGYKDAAKNLPNKYGDAVLWFQLIEYAKFKVKPLIFVTDDMKEDWWLEYEGKTISPRAELAQEMATKAGVQFYMYSADQFMAHAEEFLELPEQQAAIEEAREIRLRDAMAQGGRFLQSSLLRSVEYDSLNKVLEIELHHGEIYQYVGVPAAVYKGLMNAESHGKYFNAQIKGTYPYRQLR